MATQTIFGFVNTWTDGDAPMAGSQTADSSGINGNWWKLAEKMAALFELPATTLKSAIINGAQLKTTVFDAVTLEQDSSTKKARIKDGGVVIAKCGTDLTDGSTLEQDGTTKKIRAKTKGITATQVSDNNVKAKSYLRASVSDVGGNFYQIGGVVMTASHGIPIKRACSITAIRVRSSGGIVASFTYDAGVKTIAADSYVSFKQHLVTEFDVYINGSLSFSEVHTQFSAGSAFLTVELENS